MAQETLYCVNGDHKWKREATRGRKPIVCPKHKPAPGPVNGPITQTLHCEIGNHSWERVSQRGVKPHNCPKHKPTPGIVHVSRSANGSVDTETSRMETLHCATGDHDWERVPTRGRKPVDCPQHKVSATPPRSVPVRVISQDFPIQEIAEEELPQVEVEGDYESETTEAEQRELLNAAFNPTPEVKNRGRPKLYANEDEQKEAELARSREKVDALERNLRAHGTHISQQAPYSLYKLVRGIAGSKDAKYDFVRLFSPLAKAQFINEFPERFKAGIYYFEKDGERVDDE
jgi:hypothetical protein